MQRFIVLIILFILTFGVGNSQTWDAQTVNPGAVTAPQSVLHDSDGNPAVVYVSGTSVVLSIWNGTTWTPHTVFSYPNAGIQAKGVFLDSLFHIIIQYYYFPGGGVYWSRQHCVIRESGMIKDQFTLNGGSGTGHGDVSLSVGPGQSITLAHTDNGRLNSQRYDIVTNTWSSSVIVDDFPGVGGFNDVAIGNDGRTWISYYDGTGSNLKVARSRPSGMWDIWLIDTPGDVGLYTQIQVDAANTAHITYYDATNQRLKYATFAP